MWALLAFPLVRNIVLALVIGAAAIGGYEAWSWHLEQLGAAQERAASEARAQALRETVAQKAQAIEVEAPKSDAHKQLLKQWSRTSD